MPTLKNNIFNAPFFNVFVYTLFWAVQIVVMKFAFKEGAHPITFLIYATIFILATLSILVVPWKWSEIKEIKRDTLCKIIIVNIPFGFAAIFAYTGTALTTAINAGFLVNVTIVITLILAWIILKEKMTLVKILSALFMLIGVFFLSTKGQLIIPHFGDILILLATVFWALGNVLVRKILKHSSVSGEVVSFFRPLSTLALVAIFVLSAPIFPLNIENVLNVNFLNFSYVILAIVVGILTAGISIFLNRTLKVASASYVAMMSIMTSVMVALLAILFLNEGMVLIQIFGATLIILSGIATHYSGISKQ
ncbi:MAG TPA: DMT family transporter [Candidatus Kaiserbacteria bacterium]|nr:DMT family transporter [Candidatus Kaiserbacteria bacterium]